MPFFYPFPCDVWYGDGHHDKHWSGWAGQNGLTQYWEEHRQHGEKVLSISPFASFLHSYLSFHLYIFILSMKRGGVIYPFFYFAKLRINCQPTLSISIELFYTKQFLETISVQGTMYEKMLFSNVISSNESVKPTKNNQGSLWYLVSVTWNSFEMSQKKALIFTH